MVSVRHLLAVVAIGLLGTAARADAPVTLFAAASLTDAVSRAGDAFTDETGIALRVSFASSSTLARQIEAGAGADIYISANAQWMDYLEKRGLIEPESRRTPIANQLVLIAPGAAKVHPAILTPDFRIADRLGPSDRLAMGDPAHVPAGIYAKEALVRLGQWESLEGRLAFADNVRAALALVGRAEAALGIVYRTDALISRNVTVIAFFPADSHAPVIYPFAIVAGHDGPDVRKLFDYLTGPQGVEIFESFGFSQN